MFDRKKRYDERKDEINKLRRQNYQKDIEKNRKKERERYQKRKDQQLNYHKEKYNNDPEFKKRKQERNKKYRLSPKGKSTRNRIASKNLKKYRNKLIEILGGKICIKCGYNKDERALQIDHINGGGIKERKKGYTYLTHKKYVDNTDLARKTLQILCANCNQIKKFENKEL